MIVTTTVLAVISAFLVAVIGVLFIVGIALGALLACGMAFFYRKQLPKPPGGPLQQPYGMPRSVVEAQKQVVAKVRGMYDNKLSSRQQEILEEEVEKAILGKAPDRR